MSGAAVVAAGWHDTCFRWDLSTPQRVVARLEALPGQGTLKSPGRKLFAERDRLGKWQHLLGDRAIPRHSSESGSAGLRRLGRSRLLLLPHCCPVREHPAQPRTPFLPTLTRGNSTCLDSAGGRGSGLHGTAYSASAFNMPGFGSSQVAVGRYGTAYSASAFDMPGFGSSQVEVRLVVTQRPGGSSFPRARSASPWSSSRSAGCALASR